MLTLALTLALSAAPTAAPAKDAKPAFVLGGDPAKGAATFKTLCVSCHGEKGQGDGPAAAALNPRPANFADPKRAAETTDEYVYKMVKDGGAANGKSPLMVGWGPVLNDDAKVRDVAAYVRSLSKTAAPAPAPAPAKDAKPAPKK